MSKWQTIDTAPRDGTAVIVAVEGGAVIAEWVRHRAYINCWAWMAKPWPGCDFLMAVDPTHWMPLTEPPLPTSGDME